MFFDPIRLVQSAILPLATHYLNLHLDTLVGKLLLKEGMSQGPLTEEKRESLAKSGNGQLCFIRAFPGGLSSPLYFTSQGRAKIINTDKAVLIDPLSRDCYGAVILRNEARLHRWHGLPERKFIANLLLALKKGEKPEVYDVAGISLIANPEENFAQTIGFIEALPMVFHVGSSPVRELNHLSARFLYRCFADYGCWIIPFIFGGIMGAADVAAREDFSALSLVGGMISGAFSTFTGQYTFNKLSQFGLNPLVGASVSTSLAYLVRAGAQTLFS